SNRNDCNRSNCIRDRNRNVKPLPREVKHHSWKSFQIEPSFEARSQAVRGFVYLAHNQPPMNMNVFIFSAGGKEETEKNDQRTMGCNAMSGDRLQVFTTELELMHNDSHI
ncbi:hypothetical protein A2U01_0012952, partial [Trifolium medium]|nr:hypothetical protein [Trifolium medium]